MSSTITVKVASLTSVVTSSKTDLETGNILKLFVADKASPPPDGLTTAQLNQYYLDACVSELARYIRQEAAKNLSRERASQKQAIDDQVIADTAL